MFVQAFDIRGFIMPELDKILGRDPIPVRQTGLIVGQLLLNDSNTKHNGMLINE